LTTRRNSSSDSREKETEMDGWTGSCVKKKCVQRKKKFQTKTVGAGAPGKIQTNND
jgi:hypothetical protein